MYVVVETRAEPSAETYEKPRWTWHYSSDRPRTHDTRSPPRTHTRTQTHTPPHVMSVPRPIENRALFQTRGGRRNQSCNQRCLQEASLAAPRTCKETCSCKHRRRSWQKQKLKRHGGEAPKKKFKRFASVCKVASSQQSREPTDGADGMPLLLEGNVQKRCLVSFCTWFSKASPLSVAAATFPTAPRFTAPHATARAAASLVSFCTWFSKATPQLSVAAATFPTAPHFTAPHATARAASAPLASSSTTDDSGRNEHLPQPTGYPPNGHGTG